MKSLILHEKMSCANYQALLDNYVHFVLVSPAYGAASQHEAMLAAMGKDLRQQVFLGIKQAMWSYCKPLLKISQAKGLRDPDYGCISEPFCFIKVMAGPVRENQGAVVPIANGLISKPFPPVTGALGVIGLVARPTEGGVDDKGNLLNLFRFAD